MTFPLRVGAVVLGACTLLMAGSLRAASADPELQALREQVRALEQQLKVLAQRIEEKQSAANGPAAPAPAAAATATDKGYGIGSTDAANTIRLRALLQFDSRVFSDDGGVVNNTFALRRARLITEGTLAKNYSYQFTTEFGGSTVSMLDANVAGTFAPWLQVKAGKFKTPVGLEVLVSDPATTFIERSIVSNLLPNRDLGVQVGGDVLAGRINYAVGIFNGIADGANSNNTDFDESKDVAARIIARPFKGVAIGLGASDGRQKTTSGRTAGYRTDGQQTFFAYNSGVVADGRVWRLSPQLDFRHGPVGAMAEYVISGVTVRPGASGPKATLEHRAWHFLGSYVLTGEDSSYTGVVPRQDFHPAAGTWGAFEVVGRVMDARIDDATFPTFASPTTSANHTRSVTVGLNWHLSKAVRLMLNFSDTDFGLAPHGASSVAPLLQQDEKLFVSRVQLAF